MIIFNTFTNYKRIAKLPETDVLIWATCLIRYKIFGYTTKIFCTQKDIQFLKDWHLFELYDIIDTQLFTNCPILEKIDNTHFWSTRKIEAMYYQLYILNEPAIYTDIDIIMRQPFDLSGDVLVWSPEEWSTDEGSIYVPWRNLSKPKGYIMPKWIIDTRDAYNCGVWYFKNREVFAQYRDEYYNFCLGNPCIIKHKNRDDVADLDSNNAVWACNAEQRILKAVLTHNKQQVKFVMPERKKGWSKQGVHYFFYRISWRFLNDKDWDPAPDALPMLNLTIFECIKTIQQYSKQLYDFWSTRPWLLNFEASIDIKNKIYPIKEYY